MICEKPELVYHQWTVNDVRGIYIIRFLKTCFSLIGSIFSLYAKGDPVQSIFFVNCQHWQYCHFFHFYVSIKNSCLVIVCDIRILVHTIIGEDIEHFVTSNVWMNVIYDSHCQICHFCVVGIYIYCHKMFFKTLTPLTIVFSITQQWLG